MVSYGVVKQHQEIRRARRHVNPPEQGVCKKTVTASSGLLCLFFLTEGRDGMAYTTEISFLIVLEARSPRARSSQGWLLPGPVFWACGSSSQAHASSPSARVQPWHLHLRCQGCQSCRIGLLGFLGTSSPISGPYLRRRSCTKALGVRASTWEVC